ncbi:MAG: ABC transporter C-terminal domain-containing protein, partial [Solibacillus sp.]
TIEEIEKNMTILAESIALFEEQLCDPEIFSDHEKTLAIQTELNDTKEQHDTLELEWLELNEELENL